MVVLIKVGDVDMTIFELRENIEKYKMLEIEKNKIQINDSIEKEDKKSRIMELRQIENNIFSNITNGVKIEGDVLIDEVIKITIDFLTKYGIPKEEIINNLSNIKWFTTDTILVHGGPFVNFGNSIGVDFKYVNFNEEGYFDSFKSEYYSFLKYVLVHELLHKCSIYKNYSKITSFSGDAMSEGCTDMLALMISGGNEYASKNYDFFVKIFSFVSPCTNAVITVLLFVFTINASSSISTKDSLIPLSPAFFVPSFNLSSCSSVSSIFLSLNLLAACFEK